LGKALIAYGMEKNSDPRLLKLGAEALERAAVDGTYIDKDTFRVLGAAYQGLARKDPRSFPSS
jgi:hypothetical protein